MGDVADVVDVENIAEKLEYLYGTKQEIADAINEVGESQGVSVDSGDTFRSYADKIRALGKCEVGKISVRTTPELDEDIGKCMTFEAPEGYVWKKVKVHIDAWSAVTDEVDPLIINENGYFDVNDVSSTKFDYSEVQDPTGNPKQKGYYIRINGKYYPTEDTEVDPNKTYYVKDGTKEYETASSFIVNVQRQSAAPFTCEFLDEDEHVLETHNDIPYGGWCSYQGAIPTSKSGLTFQGWNPAPNNIQSNIRCHPVFYTPNTSVDEWPESWAEIVTKHGEGIPIGAWKILPLTDNKVTFGGVEYTVQQAVKMVKVYNGEDVSTSTWLSSTCIFDMYAFDSATDEHGLAEGPYPYGDESGLCFVRDLLNEGVMGIIPDYIRQFIVPVTKYFSACVCHAGVPQYNTALGKVQDYIWIPSAREVNYGNDVWSQVHENENYRLYAGKGPVYSQIFDGTPENRWQFYQGAISDIVLRDAVHTGDGYGHPRVSNKRVALSSYYEDPRGRIYTEWPCATGVTIGFCL